MVQGRQTDGSPVMVKMYFNNQVTKEERSLSRFDSKEDKECLTRVLNAPREERETDSDICEDRTEEEDKGILVQSCDDGEQRAMKKNTDSDSDRDSELVGNHRRWVMTSGPRHPATLKAKRLSDGNHGGTDQQPHAFGCKPFVAAIGSAGDPPEYDSEDSMPSLVDDSVEHREDERPEVTFRAVPCLHAASHATSTTRGQSALFRPSAIRSLGVGRFAGYLSERPGRAERDCLGIRDPEIQLTTATSAAYHNITGERGQGPTSRIRSQTAWEECRLLASALRDDRSLSIVELIKGTRNLSSRKPEGKYGLEQA